MIPGGHKIAIIGDLHGHWNALDNEFFARSDHDLLLFVGDLGSGSRKNGLEVVRMLSRISTPALVLPGNNDAPHLAQMAAEFAFQSGKAELMQLMGASSAMAVEACGFSSHQIHTLNGRTTLIAGRPCAMGGSALSFAPQLSRAHGVKSLEESRKRLEEIVDTVETDTVLFMGHNGPFGLGHEAPSQWARDFPLPKGLSGEEAPWDWGDSDLQAAVSHAKARGLEVLCVIAGHMHRSRDASSRPLCVEREGTQYVNAAVVPRIVESEKGEEHHVVELCLDLSQADSRKRVSVSERWLLLRSDS